MIQPKYILSLHADSSVRNVAVALVLTDGVDILETPKSFHRPFPEDLQQILHTSKEISLTDELQIKNLDKQTTDFFIQVLQEAMELWKTNTIDYICLSGVFLTLSSNQHQAIELGNLQHIANTFHKPVIGRFVQSDMNAGGVGSPLLSVFWQQMTQHLNKPLFVVGLGGVLKMTYIGENGELGACDIGVGFALMEKWITLHSQEDEDDFGILSAKGQANQKVVKAMMNHPFLSLPPPKAIHRNDFDILLEQLAGLSLQDGCATIIDFMVQMIKQAGNFFHPNTQNWLFIGSERKNVTLMLKLAQEFPHIYKIETDLPFSNHLNAVGYAFLGARFLADLPISLPQTTGSDCPLTCGIQVHPK